MKSTYSRPSHLNSAKRDFFDVIVIGGGITGVGIALDAVLRGLKVLLIEQNDFASGTSSKSTKLIHGGLRYLKQYEFALVREVGKERAILHKLAPHLVRPEKMLLPLTKHGNYGKIIASVGLMVYDVLANVDEEDQRKMLSIEETLKVEPLLDAAKIEGGGLYSEYQTDDFRLVIEIAKSVANEGATILNYTSFEKFLEKGGTICGIEAKDSFTGETFKVYSDYVINAAGPWVDDVRNKDIKVSGKHLRLTKGVHLVVPYDKLPVTQSVYFDIADGRMMFAIPKNGITYLGTTDTEYTGDPNLTTTTQADVDYLINATNAYFPSAALKTSDVVSSWSGVRPLIEEEGKSASEVSRKDEIFVSQKGLISIAGGKLTGYRKMAKRTVEKLLEIRDEQHATSKSLKCKTKKYKLPGNEFKNPEAIKKYKIALGEANESATKEEVNYLVDIYGAQAAAILDLAKQQPNTGTDLIRAEVQFCLENEMVFRLTDFFIRRTGRLFFDIESVRNHLEMVTQEMSNWFSWSEKRIQEEKNLLTEEINKATRFN